MPGLVLESSLEALPKLLGRSSVTSWAFTTEPDGLSKATTFVYPERAVRCDLCTLTKGVSLP